MKFTVPLRVKVSKNKYFILNLNNYRNARYRVLSNAKNNFHDIMLNLNLPRKTFSKVKLKYKIYPASRRLYDGNNVISIVDKFVMDSLVKMGFLRDDNIFHVACYEWEACPPDRGNPRIEIEVIELDNKGSGSKYLDRLLKIYKR